MSLLDRYIYNQAIMKYPYITLLKSNKSNSYYFFLSIWYKKSSLLVVNNAIDWLCGTINFSWTSLCTRFTDDMRANTKKNLGMSAKRSYRFLCITRKRLTNPFDNNGNQFKNSGHTEKGPMNRRSEVTDATTGVRGGRLPGRERK